MGTLILVGCPDPTDIEKTGIDAEWTRDCRHLSSLPWPAVQRFWVVVFESALILVLLPIVLFFYYACRQLLLDPQRRTLTARVEWRERTFRAGDLLATAGVPIVLLTEGSRVVAARLSHVWVKAFLDYIPDRGVSAGPGDTWLRMDPAFARHEFTDGIRVVDQVPFSLASYLESGAADSPRRVYEDALWSYIRGNGILCSTLDQLKQTARVRSEAFPFVPGTLRAKILRVDGTAADVPAEFMTRVRLQVKTAAGQELTSWDAPMAELYGQRIDILYGGATADDQATIDSFGGIFETPPYLVDLEPAIRKNGVAQAAGGVIGSAEDTEIFVTLEPVGGAPTVLVLQGLAGEHHLFVVDFSQLPASRVTSHQEALVALQDTASVDELEARLLQLVGETYLHRLGKDLGDLSGWTWRRLVRLGTEGLVSVSGQVTTTIDGAPLNFERAETFIDVATLLGIFAIAEAQNPTRETLELLGAQSSFLEGSIFPQTLGQIGVSAVGALTRAQREGQALRQVDGGNVSQVLAEVELGDEVETAVRQAVGAGKIAWVAEAPITVGLWRGTGYILEDPTTGAAAYLISGGYAGGATAGPLTEGDERDLLGFEDWLEGNSFTRLISYFFQLLVHLATEVLPSTNHSDPINLALGNNVVQRHRLDGAGPGHPDHLDAGLQQPQRGGGLTRPRLVHELRRTARCAG